MTRFETLYINQFLHKQIEPLWRSMEWKIFCFFFRFPNHLKIVYPFILQHLNHPRTSESLPPDYNIPNQYHLGQRSYGSVQGQSRIRVIRHDDLAGSGETRSELLIQQTSIQDNGTYFCQAENKAARSVSNFTLHVTDSVDSPTILQVCKKKIEK